MAALLLSLALFSAKLVRAEGGPPDPAELAAIQANINIEHYLSIVWGSLIAAGIVYNIVFIVAGYIRTIACMNNEKQQYFATPHPLWGKVKRYFVDAPLIRQRHNREFKLSSAINMGTLPSRLQTAFLSGYLGMNIAYTVITIDWTLPWAEVSPLIRNRAGVLAVLNMIPLYLLAARNNPLIRWCGISFDSFNLIHRWIGRLVVVEAIVHTLAWLILKVQTKGWAVVGKSIAGSEFLYTGLIGTIAFTLILFQSPSMVRHAFYEVFLHTHIVLAAVATGGVWIHLNELASLQQLLLIAICFWALERFARFCHLIYRNVGNGGTQAEVEVLPGDAIRVNLNMARPWRFQTGQHVYLYMPTVGFWTSHPFSLAWSEEQEDLSSEKGLAMHRQDIMNMSKTSMSLIIRRRTGFTEHLYRKAEASPGGKFATSAFVEGPYGVHQSLHSYGTVMLFAAGVGITHQVPHVRELVDGYANGTVAARKVVLVWIIQSPEHLEWIRPWMTTILSMPRRREVLKILLFVTRPRSTKEIHSPSSSVQMFPGKPNVGALVAQEEEQKIGAMAVTVCGVGALADEVRRAARLRMTHGNVDFIEESFTW